MEESDKNRARLEEIEREIANLKEKKMALESQFENEKAVFNEIAKIKAKIEELKVQANSAERAGELSKVAEIRYGLIPAEEKKLKELEEKWARMQKEGTLLKNSVDEEMIASIISRWTGIPVNKMLQSEKDKILNIENILNQEVCGTR